MKDNSKVLHKILMIIFMFVFHFSWSQTVFGKWKTVDDRNGITKAIVEVYEENGLLQAKILKILEKGKENALCVKCKGDLKNKPVTGMKIMDNYKRNSKGEYKGNRLFDPEQAMTFRGKVWLDPKDTNKLKVRGYLAFLYRTQTWHRVIEE
ncbi:DUF2147 domain-containing protein [Flagellimonas pacifica]|uniref:Uncharacterized conserved protein, DUF2147 family n=1 Tax=Flagellimonas pacifica TaxID=1247520 RepID=A0A285MYR1_9FLAO|nr:DUF2147 domain-containing protein [Allomuricauda parva]SNZ00621.1 Uncharacterized conserved protein, DUF2147 family [Allomuricauda parva]